VKGSLAFALGALSVAVLTIVVAIKILLRVPSVPYNVSELFLDDASVVAVGFFAVSVLWIGAGAMLGAFAIAKSRRPYVVLPVVVLAASLVSKLLVSRGVTYESLDDILGSNNVFDLVTHQNIWGGWWRAEFLRIGIDTVDFVERRVRYCALYSVPLLALTFALLPRANTMLPRRMSRAAMLSTIAVGVLWLWLCTAVVLAWAATDNLTELIASPLFLFAVVVVMALNVELVVRARRSVISALVAIVASAACVVATWFLLNAGLEQQVHKYSFVFSGTQFLLGPDRQHALSRAILFARWCVVYAGAVGVVAVGVWIAEMVIAGVRVTSAQSPAGSTAPGAP
jgi:hypothetical protein